MARHGQARSVHRRRFLTAVVVGLGIAGACGAVGAWSFYRQIEAQVANKFSGRRWNLPSRIYSSPFVLFPGVHAERSALLERLSRLGYVRVDGPPRRPGDYRLMEGRALELSLRGDPASTDGAKRVRLQLDEEGRVVRMVAEENGEELSVLELPGEPLAGIYDRVWESRRLVSVPEVPSLLVQAILAAEDRRFFEHAGVDWRAVLRALWVNMRAGGVQQGGSTLTQQLMKNFFLSTERTVQRKIVELVMAIIAERRYSKLEILESYLNEIYLGQAGAKGIFGIGEGAHFYFGKDPGDMTLGQTALLAGLIQAPNRYSPYHSPERALKRRNVVLSRMRRFEMITDVDYREARAEPLGVRPAVEPPRVAPYFVDYVEHELSATHPVAVLTQDGLQIYTALDAELQRAAEQAVQVGLGELEQHYEWLRPKANLPSLEACLVAIHPHTGEIKAMVGGRSYGQSQFNRVVQARRQVGSLFKPVVYAAALIHGHADGSLWLPTSRVDDTPFEWAFDSQVWKPANYADEYFGFVTLREALERSLNAATARTAYEVGLAAIVSTARELGFDGPLPMVPAIVLGAGEATPLQVARVYAAFANGGLRPTPLATRRVETASGQILERRGIQLERAIASDVAFMVTHMLRGVLERGTGRAGQLEVPAAGKTGTTDGYRDAWFAGYTPDLVTVVWVGFDQERALKLPASRAALPIWAHFMRIATAGRPGTPFRAPPGVTLARIDPESGELATDRCPTVIEEAFPVSASPATPCRIHSSSSLGAERQNGGREGEREEGESHRRRWLPWPF
jgi:penicillin-binding protein 1B